VGIHTLHCATGTVHRWDIWKNLCYKMKTRTISCCYRNILSSASVSHPIVFIDSHYSCGMHLQVAATASPPEGRCSPSPTRPPPTPRVPQALPLAPQGLPWASLLRLHPSRHLLVEVPLPQGLPPAIPLALMAAPPRRALALRFRRCRPSPTSPSSTPQGPQLLKQLSSRPLANSPINTSSL
jgi:hypothetical protein